MERYDVKDEPLLGAIVEAIEHGDEVVITRQGEVVAELRLRPRAKATTTRSIDPAALQAVRDRLHLPHGNGADLVREMRDETNW